MLDIALIILLSVQCSRLDVNLSCRSSHSFNYKLFTIFNTNATFIKAWTTQNIIRLSGTDWIESHHEPGGTVVEVGKNVKHLHIGDRVALEPGKTCGHCEFCREGKYNLCPDVLFFATPPIDGVFQEYVAHEADLCFKLPEDVDTMEGALIEPLAVGFHEP